MSGVITNRNCRDHTSCSADRYCETQWLGGEYGICNPCEQCGNPVHCPHCVNPLETPPEVTTPQMMNIPATLSRGEIQTDEKDYYLAYWLPGVVLFLLISIFAVVGFIVYKYKQKKSSRPQNAPERIPMVESNIGFPTTGKRNFHDNLSAHNTETSFIENGPASISDTEEGGSEGLFSESQQSNSENNDRIAQVHQDDNIESVSMNVTPQIDVGNQNSKPDQVHVVGGVSGAQQCVLVHYTNIDESIEWKRTES